MAQYNNGNGTPSEIVRYSLDEFGRSVRIIQDTDGNLSTTADQRVTDKVYDDVGRVVSVAEQIDYVYSLTGLLEEIHLPGDVITCRASGKAATTSLQSKAWGWAPKRKRRSPTPGEEPPFFPNAEGVSERP